MKKKIVMCFFLLLLAKTQKKNSIYKHKMPITVSKKKNEQKDANNKYCIA